MTIQNICRSAIAALALISSSVYAGSAVAPTTTTLPVDSPWAVAGLAAVLAIVGYRLLKKK